MRCQKGSESGRVEKGREGRKGRYFGVVREDYFVGDWKVSLFFVE